MHQRRGQLLARITTEPLDAAADALRRVMPRVLDDVLVRLRNEVPELQGRSRSYLQDALPDVLDQLARVMAEGTTAAGMLSEKAQQHAAHRQEQDLHLDEMLLEYQLLREALPQSLVTELGRELSPEESTRLHAALDLSLRESAALFAHQQKRRLQSEAAAMAKYLSFLSHDLRGNLNGAMLMIEVLRRDLQSEPRFAESMTDLDAMRQSMLELVGTMDRFLQAERLRLGRVEVSLQTVDIAEFLREQRRGIARQVRGVDEQIDIDVGESPLHVVTDREMLGLVLQNTLSNCVKYRSGGRVRLRAYHAICDARHDAGDATGAGESKRAERGGRVCRIEVSDNGPGMDDAIKQRLFEPFSRGLDTGRQGTGLGLFIAKQAGDLLGATLTVRSELGAGTTFVIDLPDYTFSLSPESLAS